MLSLILLLSSFALCFARQCPIGFSFGFSGWWQPMPGFKWVPPSQCAAECDSKCAGMVIGGPGSRSGCWLYSALGRRVNKPSGFGYVACINDNFNLPESLASYTRVSPGCVLNHDIDTIEGKSLEECGQICTAEPACAAFEYRMQPPICKPQVSTYEFEKCNSDADVLDLYIKKGKRPCAQNYQYFGSLLPIISRTFQVSFDAVSKCHQSCIDVAECSHWHYGDDACTLFAGNGEQQLVSGVGYWFGERGCEFRSQPTLRVPTNCVLDPVATKASCPETCGTIAGVGNPPALMGGAQCPTYDCQPGDGLCIAVDCTLPSTQGGYDTSSASLFQCTAEDCSHPVLENVQCASGYFGQPSILENWAHPAEEQINGACNQGQPMVVLTGCFKGCTLPRTQGGYDTSSASLIQCTAEDCSHPVLENVQCAPGYFGQPSILENWVHPVTNEQINGACNRGQPMVILTGCSKGCTLPSTQVGFDTSSASLTQCTSGDCSQPVLENARCAQGYSGAPSILRDWVHPVTQEQISGACNDDSTMVVLTGCRPGKCWYERRNMGCPSVGNIGGLGRVPTFAECQAGCDARDDCDAIQINTRTRHPRNNCLLYSNECNENRADGICTSIKDCFYFERVCEDAQEVEPTYNPTLDPTVNPTVAPTSDPTGNPTINPTASPTADPTAATTPKPTESTAPIVDTGNCAWERRWWSRNNDYCSCRDGYVKIGRWGRWSEWQKVQGSGVRCQVSQLGDPLWGVTKECRCGYRGGKSTNGNGRRMLKLLSGFE